ncbi:MAG TPA: hypothetical protein VMU25_01480 [Candidatus Paceibacterota bacterium]|nr:hypothetical protein [Candidatus Paceibacterota bacterium]
MSDQVPPLRPEEKTADDITIERFARKALFGDKEQLPLNDNSKEWPLIPFPDDWYVTN